MSCGMLSARLYIVAPVDVTNFGTHEPSGAPRLLYVRLKQHSRSLNMHEYGCEWMCWRVFVSAVKEWNLPCNGLQESSGYECSPDRLLLHCLMLTAALKPYLSTEGREAGQDAFCSRVTVYC